MKLQAIPNDSRYVPFTQQPACCVPTCIQMVMYKNDIPLIPSEEIGYPLGLIVHGDDLRKILEQVEVANSDALLCFNHGALVDDKDKDWGHVVVFDRVIDGKIRIVDPSPEHPKWRLVGVEKMFGAMQEHGVARSGGVWLIEKKEQ
jgi:hypothetical protein